MLNTNIADLTNVSQSNFYNAKKRFLITLLRYVILLKHDGYHENHLIAFRIRYIFCVLPGYII